MTYEQWEELQEHFNNRDRAFDPMYDDTKYDEAEDNALMEEINRLMEEDRNASE